MSIQLKEVVTSVYDSIIDSQGIRWRLDKLLTGDAARVAQVYPGFSVIYVSSPGADTQCHSALTVPDYHLKEILNGQMIIHISPGG